LLADIEVPANDTTISNSQIFDMRDSSQVADRPGMICVTAAPTPDVGYLLCDGSAYSRALFAALYARIGTTWGAGDGSTTFNVPNFGGRVPVGVNGAYALGATGGEAAHTLTIAEMPSHAHDGFAFGGSNTFTDGSGATPVINQVTPFGVNPTGGGTSHNNMQPYAAANYQIKF
jgi:microcystin-dependent protein